MPPPAQVHSSELLGAGAGARGPEAAGTTPPARDHDARRIARLEQQCTRLANELASVAQDADRRDREHEARLSSLTRRLHECEGELAERDARLAMVTRAHEALQSQVEEGHRPLTASAEVYRRELRRHAEVVERLKERLEESGRALGMAQAQIAALHQERSRLLDALDERGRQVALLLAQLTRGEVRDGFGMDFRSGLEHFLRREAAIGTEGAAVGDVNEQTVVLGPADPPHAPPAPTAATDAVASRRVPAVPAPSSGGSSADGPRPRAARLRRYLVPAQPGREQAYELTGPRSYVGRGIAADVCLDQPTVSRLHSVLYSIGGATVVEDARSANGVYVNGQRVQQAVLKDGDLLAFGNLEFRFLVAIQDL